MFPDSLAYGLFSSMVENEEAEQIRLTIITDYDAGMI